MLMSLQVRDFAIVEAIDIEFGPGMTVLTGETGAGKSILVDALGLVLGERGNAKMVRPGAKRAEFSAEFNVARLDAVRGWLEEQALDVDDDCLLRRVIGSDGRSRAFVNGNAVSLSQLKNLGEHLLDIHGQHFHQSLGKRAIQRELLDHFGKLGSSRDEVSRLHKSWSVTAESLRALQAADTDRSSRLDMLAFQLQELDSVSPEAGEAEQLFADRRKLQNAGQIAANSNDALEALMDQDGANANSLIAAAQRSLASLAELDSEVAPVAELLDSAAIQVAEAAAQLRQYAGDVDADPGRRDWIEERIDSLQSLARKHRVEIDDLPTVATELRQEFDDLENADVRGRELEDEVNKCFSRYQRAADKLSAARRKRARELSDAVTSEMADLGMPGGHFEVAVTPVAAGAEKPWGVDEIDYLICANPGQKAQPLSNVASGGELSRMSLAIQVIASDGSAIPTMVFDEVDSGVGGGVAEMVGRRLRQIAATRQVLCVTHLPQVASQANQHFRISKVTDGKTTRTGLEQLDRDSRVRELARMMGGVDITATTLEHAAEMLDSADAKRA